MPKAAVHTPYLVDNNRQLDMQALEQRMQVLLAEQPPLPVASQPLPSSQPVPSLSALQRLLARLRRSYLVSQWLPRHPRLYRRARAIYQRFR